MKIDACFFCGTPYQVLSAVAITMQKKYNADLYILKYFDCEKIGAQLKRCGLFNNVFLIDKHTLKEVNEKNKILRWSKIIYAYFRLEEVVGRYIQKCVEYEHFFCSNYNVYGFGLALEYFRRKNLNMQMHHFDDGEGSYDTVYLQKCSPRIRFARRVIFGKRSVDFEQKFHLYSPELYKKFNPNLDMQIEKIPYIWNQPEMQQLAKDIFGVTENELQTNDIVLLDTVHNEVFQDAGEQEISTIYEKIFTCFGKDKILIKRHPRDTFAGYEGCRYCQQTSAPFEVLAMGVDMNTKLLIGFGSTSFVNSKILKDEEPYVLLLYKLIKNRKFYGDKNRSDRYYHAVKSMYRNPEKFMIPETMEELDECLKKLKEVYFI